MQFFNHGITRLAITAFMDFFSKFSIEKYGSVPVSAGSGDLVFVQRKIIPVPVQWAAREKWVEIVRSSSARKAMDPAIRDKNPVEMMWILPRISVNLTGITYDSNRRLIKTQNLRNCPDNPLVGNQKNSSYSPAPYNLELEVATISRHIDDNLQLMEQIIPYFAPTMNMNLNLYGLNSNESIPITLNSVAIDIPIDIPEFEERIFINTYSFSMKLNYFMIKKLQGIITGININMQNGGEYVQLSKEWLAAQNKIENKFNYYSSNALRRNPLTDNSTLTDDAIAALGKIPLYAYIGTDGMLHIEKTAVSGTEYENLFSIYYRTDDSTDIKEYIAPLDITFTKIYFWMVYAPPNQVDATQLQVWTFDGAIGSNIIGYNFKVA